MIKTDNKRYSYLRKSQRQLSVTLVEQIPPPPTLLEKLDTIWKQPSSLDTAFGDFGRLAPRVIVLGSLTGKNKDGYVKRKKYGYENVDTRSFKVWLNEGIISQSASEWSGDYTKCTLAFVRKSGKKGVLLRLYIPIAEKNTEISLCITKFENIFRVKDSSRFFILENIYLRSSDKARTIGIAFHAKDQSDSFATLFRHFSGFEVPYKGIHEDKKVKQDNIPESKIGVSQLELERISRHIDQLLLSSDQLVDLPRMRESVHLRLAEISTGPIEREVLVANTRRNPEMTESTHARNLRALRGVLAALTDQLDPPPVKKKIINYIDNQLYNNEEGDLTLEVKHIINKYLGIDSATTRVLCAVNQNIVSVCIMKIKQLLMNANSQVLTGDVQGPSGWQICVLFARDVISISHRRRERSLGTKPNAGFWFEWILYMTFDQNMEKLISCLLKVTDLYFEEEIDEQSKEKVKLALCNGALILE